MSESKAVGVGVHPPLEGVEARVARGLRFSALGQALMQGSQLPMSLVLSRLLVPEDFGRVGQLMVFVGFANLLADFGLGTLIVQRPHLDDADLDAIFWFNVLVGLALALLFALATPLIALLFDDPSLVPLALWLCPSFLLGALRVVPSSLLRRELAFGRLALVDASTTLLAGLAGIAVALCGGGVYALVVEHALYFAVPALLSFRYVKFRPGWRFVFSRLRPFLRFGGFLLVSNFAAYATKNVDNLLVARFFGQSALGLYLRAFEFARLPSQQINSVANRVMVSGLSRMGDDRARVRDAVSRGLHSIALVSLPLMTLCMLTPQALLAVLFGPAWVAAAPLVPAMCWVGIFASLTSPASWLFLSRGQSGAMLRWELCAGALRIGAMLAGLHFGPSGVATGLALAYGVLFLPSLASAGRSVGWTSAHSVRALVWPAGCTLAMAALALSLLHSLATDLRPVFVLLLVWLPALGSYVGLLALFRVPGWRSLRGFALG